MLEIKNKIGIIIFVSVYIMKDNRLGVNLDEIVRLVKLGKTECCEKKCLKRKKVKQRQPVNTSKNSNAGINSNEVKSSSAGISSNAVSNAGINFNGLQNTIQNDTAKITNDIAKYELKASEFRNNQFIKQNENRFSNEILTPQINPINPLRYNNYFKRMGDEYYEPIEGNVLPQYNNLEPQYKQYNVKGYAVEEDAEEKQKLNDEVNASSNFVEPKKIQNAVPMRRKKIVKPKPDFDITGDEEPVNTNQTKRSALETEQEEKNRIALENTKRSALEEDEDRQLSIRKIERRTTTTKIPSIRMTKARMIQAILSYIPQSEQEHSYSKKSLFDVTSIYNTIPQEIRDTLYKTN